MSVYLFRDNSNKLLKSKILLKVCDGNRNKKKMVPVLAAHFVDKDNVVIVYTTNLVLTFEKIVSIVFLFDQILSVCLAVYT